ncbi:MAG: hypothetical protein V4565_02275 [Bacteroidota bacterium]
MGRIDIHNYEAFLLDLSEGNLNDEMQMELELFLIQHPELNIDLHDVSMISVEKEAILFLEKNNLKKSESELISETQFIAYIEKQLSSDERLVLEKSCFSNPSLSKELEHYKSTIAAADVSIVYSDKNRLKRKPKVIWFNSSATQYLAAACILFLIGLYIFWPKSDSNISNSKLAVNHVVNPKLKEPIVSPVKKEKEQEPNNSAAQKMFASNQNKTSITKNSLPNQNENSLLKDTLKQEKSRIEPAIELSKNESLMAINTLSSAVQSKTIVDVITENDDEPLSTKTELKKKGIWGLASRTLKNLNHLGVKAVDGDENSHKDKTSYALTLGGINISHKANL